MRNWRITTRPSAFTLGLFGGIVTLVFEALPKLYQNAIFPQWQITSINYGIAPDFTVIPGLFDLNYKTNKTETKDMDLMHLRRSEMCVLGSQWEVLHNLWSAYFRVPSRIVERADKFGDLSHALGLHYRGTDKNKDLACTNPVSYDDFLTLVTHFVNDHKDIDKIFVASDENGIKELIERNYEGRRVIDTGKVSFWRTEYSSDVTELQGASQNYVKGEHAVLDCLLLSRCKYLIQNESALSGFAKVLNPKLEAYRIAASKLWWYCPYFPDAYIPPLASEDPKCKGILNRLLKGDWTQNPEAWRIFGKPFATMERPPRSTRIKLILSNPNLRINEKLSSLVFWFWRELVALMRNESIDNGGMDREPWPYRHPRLYSLLGDARIVGNRMKQPLNTVGRLALRKSIGSIRANPNPCSGVAVSVGPWLGATTLSWESRGTTSVEVHVGAPDGPLFSRGESSGSSATGRWVTNGMAFYLQDVSEGLPLTPKNTLGTVTVILKMPRSTTK